MVEECKLIDNIGRCNFGGTNRSRTERAERTGGFSTADEK